MRMTSYQGVLWTQPSAGLANKVNPLQDAQKSHSSDLSRKHNDSEEEQHSTRESEPAPEDKEQLRKLKQRDAEVRRHEQTHKAVGGAHAGAPSYEYTKGPDGKMYASGGSVNIDTSEVPNDPEATVRKLEQVKRAALAPAEPSAADRKVAANASAKIMRARAQMRDESQGTEEDTKEGSTSLQTGESPALKEIQKYQQIQSGKSSTESTGQALRGVACGNCGNFHS